MLDINGFSNLRVKWVSGAEMRAAHPYSPGENKDNSPSTVPLGATEGKSAAKPCHVPTICKHKMIKAPIQVSVSGSALLKMGFLKSWVDNPEVKVGRKETAQTQCNNYTCSPSQVTECKEKPHKLLVGKGKPG